MEVFKIKNLTFKYPNREALAIDNVNFSVKRGEFVCLCGKSGSGKTTLLKILKPSLSPNGAMSGEICFYNNTLKDLSKRDEAEKIGFVMQDTENQIVTDKVWHELAFGLENFGVVTSEIQRRVAEISSFFGIDDWFYKKTEELSGGQKQILNLASVMAMNPEVLILDEPTSQLDPISAIQFLHILEKINKELGTTIIISEHRLEEVVPLCERVLVMDEGKIIADTTPRLVGAVLKKSNHPMFYALPTPMCAYGAVEEGENYPLTVKEGREWFKNYKDVHGFDFYSKTNDTSNDIVLALNDVWYRYEKDLPDVLGGVIFSVNRGEIFAVFGANGGGKTTLLSVILGILKKQRGQILINGEQAEKLPDLYSKLLGYLPQDVKVLFTKMTVLEELFDMEKDVEKIDYFAKLCGIEELYDYHPYDLSGGESERLALCKVLLKDPEILLLDEPTKGFDAEFKEAFKDILYSLKEMGKTVIMVSHDVEFCAHTADRCCMFFNGTIIGAAPAREFLKNNDFYTTKARKMTKNIADNVILSEDIISGFGKELKKPKVKKQKVVPKEKPKEPEAKNKKTVNKTTLFSMIFLLLAVPMTIFLGNRYLDDKKFFFVSLAIIFETIISFFLSFERKKPDSKELVIIGVLCALAVCGRVAFAYIPQFKAILAVIILAGVCFGAETGFLVGAVGAFVSNFFFGQGAWTPYQMFAMGIVGLLAGAIFNGANKKSRITLSVFSFLVTVFVYGVIMNSASVLMVQKDLTYQAVVTFCLFGLPMDIVHGVATVIFIWFAGVPLIKKIERVKTKYGI